MPRVRVEPADSGLLGPVASPALVRVRKHALDLARSRNDRLTEATARTRAQPVDGSRHRHRSNQHRIVEYRGTDRSHAGGALGDAFHPIAPLRRRSAEEYATTRPFVQWQLSANRNDRSELCRRLDRDQAQSLLAAAHKQLAALAGLLSQIRQDMWSDLEEAEFGESTPCDVAAAFVASGESVRLQRRQESIGRGPGEVHEFNQLLKAHWLAVFDDIEKVQYLVEDFDAADQSDGHDQHSRMSPPQREIPGRDILITGAPV